MQRQLVASDGLSSTSKIWKPTRTLGILTSILAILRRQLRLRAKRERIPLLSRGLNCARDPFRRGGARFG